MVRLFFVTLGQCLNASYRFTQAFSRSIVTTFRSSRSRLSGYDNSNCTLYLILVDDRSAQLTLTDRSVTVSRESSTALGQGCRLGFLGTLHMDVFRQRLEDEYDSQVIITAPTVPYKGALSRLTTYLTHDAYGGCQSSTGTGRCSSAILRTFRT